MNIIELLKKEWDSQGECRSCGYHASLHEYVLDEEELQQELKEDGFLEFGCHNEDGGGHRGVRVYLKEPESNQEGENNTLPLSRSQKKNINDFLKSKDGR